MYAKLYVSSVSVSTMEEITYSNLSEGNKDRIEREGTWERGSLSKESAHFLPMQALGPTKNGWLASFVSVEFESNQRSGLNSIGSAKN